MQRLIDANAVIVRIPYEEFNARMVIANAPTVDAEPVRHGHWINHFDDLFPEESTQECSVCHAEQMGTMLNDNYCPNCGARMNKRRQEK